MRSRATQAKIWAAAGLALVSLALIIASELSEDREVDAELLQTRDLSIIQAEIDAKIDSLLLEYGAQIQTISMRKIPEGGVGEAPAGPTVAGLNRVEREVRVSRSFSTVDFNRRLSNLVARYGVHVSGRENRELRTTSMDLRIGERLVETIVLVAQK